MVMDVNYRKKQILLIMADDETFQLGESIAKVLAERDIHIINVPKSNTGYSIYAEIPKLDANVIYPINHKPICNNGLIVTDYPIPKSKNTNITPKKKKRK